MPRFFCGVIFASICLTADCRFSASRSIDAIDHPSHNIELSSESGLRIEEVRNFMSEYRNYLHKELEKKRDDLLVKGCASLLFYADPFSCRLCVAASTWIFEDLQERFPLGLWQVRRTLGADHALFDGLTHDYVYSQQLDIIVDATYKQFFVHVDLSALESLPEIFIGSSEEFSRLATGLIDSSVINAYLNRFQIRTYPANVVRAYPRLARELVRASR